MAWDNYVRNHPRATVYHLSGWKQVIEKTYGHQTYYLIALKDEQNLRTLNDKNERSLELSASDPINPSNPIVGILPLVHIKHFLFGNSLISMPFLDYGGILADDRNIEMALLSHATKLGQELKTSRIELRHIDPLPWLNESPRSTAISKEISAMNWVFQTRSHKVRMLLQVSEDPEILMESFKSKLRSQIKKPVKEGCTAAVGHVELLGDFYNVFSTNMRDLGSPVHSRRLIENVLNEFPDEARICIVFKDKQALAASVVIGFRDTLENPWASSLREFSRLSPNMLLYWTMLEHACKNGYRYFDFGRSSLAEGTYQFKSQWGATPLALHWYYIATAGKSGETSPHENSRFERAIRFWQRLPVPITKVLGPSIRKHIGL
jgi:FemAB-related protein (PEP-CTERM system-associated)